MDLGGPEIQRQHLWVTILEGPYDCLAHSVSLPGPTPTFPSVTNSGFPYPVHPREVRLYVLSQLRWPCRQ